MATKTQRLIASAIAELEQTTVGYTQLKTRPPTSGRWGDGLSLLKQASAAAAAPVYYVNPFARATGLVPARTDDGVDYFADKDVPIGAPGRSVILLATTDSNWPGPYGSKTGFGGKGGLIHAKFLDGPHAGEHWYLAEFIYVDVKLHQIVQAGEQIARFYHPASSGVGIEIGYGVGGNSQIATEAGKCFARFLKKHGCSVRDNPGPGSEFSPFGKS